jgi:hypothetical protein
MHAQIRELMQTHPTFREDVVDTDVIAKVAKASWTKRTTLGPFTFEALVAEEHWRTCHLDILLLRRAAPGGVFIGGDIDNRIKTLLDGLRSPHQLTELPPGDTPKEDENPFYVLLDDDKLVSGFNVRTDRLLSPISAYEGSDYARLVMDVSVQVSRVPWRNIPFLGD